MALILAPPQTQWIDADGEPIAGGTVETYVVGTTTAKNTWQDEGATILNTNPIVLDAAGRAIIWGTGDYRFIVRDNTGQLVYDGVTSAVDLSGLVTTAQLNAAVQVETNRAEAAENTLTTNLNAEISRAEAAETTLTNDLNAEIARAEAAEAHLQSEISGLGSGVLPTGYSIRFGQTTSDGSGNFSGTFSPPFPTTCDALTVSSWGRAWWACVDSRNASGFTGKTSSPLAGGSWDGGPISVDYIAIGH